ncbi:MAG: CDP-glycerol glycerophosphotransferase family protein [Nocardioidaceae bacterium]
MRRVARAAARRLRSPSAGDGPLVSVVVVVRDDGAHLDGCLRGVLAASHQAVEVLVVGGRPGATSRARRVRALGDVSVDEAVQAATGEYLVLVDSAEVVPADAWAAMVATLQETGSDLLVGAQSTRTPRSWAGELFARRRLRETAAGCPLALVDLSLTNKMFRLASWRAAGLRVGSWEAGAQAVLAAYLAAAGFDVVPRVVSEVPARDASLPVAEQARFRPATAEARLASLCALAPQAPDDWLPLALTHLLPPMYVDAVGGGPAYFAVLQPGVRALWEGADPALVPVAARLGAWVAAHGTLDDVALLQDLLAESPDGLPVTDGLVAVPDALSAPPPASWRAVEDVDRRVRCRVEDRLLRDGARWVVRGATLTEYLPDDTLPEVTLVVAGAPPVPLTVEHRRWAGAGEWAARAWEDHAGAGWQAGLDAPLLPADGRAEVEVRLGSHLTRSAVRTPPPPDPGAVRVDGVALEDGVLRLQADLPAGVAAAVAAGPRGSTRTPVSAGEASVRLVAETFGEDARLPTGRYELSLVADGGAPVPLAWADGLLDDPPELLDGRFRVTLEAGPAGAAVHVRAPLGRDERGAFAQQRLQSLVYAAPGAPSYDTTVVLESFHGRSVGDNPGAIGRELLARDLGLDLVWVVDDPALVLPEGTRPVARRSRAWYDVLAHARGYVANAAAPYFFEKRPGQHHLQTWHGTPLKRIGEDRGPGDFQTWRHRRRVAGQAARWDAMVSPSRYCSDIFRTAFRYDGPFLEVGYPRNDALLTDEGALRQRTRERLGLADADRVVLYAPTWREYVGVRDAKPLYLDAERLTAKLPDAMVLIRGHYNSTGQADVFAGHPRIRDVTRYPDIADLFLAADALVTDYSSVMFDFALTDKPVVLLVPDLAQYRDVERGFYFELEDRAPGPLVDSTDAVARALRGPDRHAAQRAAFREEFCPFDDGRASARVVDALLAHW